MHGITKTIAGLSAAVLTVGLATPAHAGPYTHKVVTPGDLIAAMSDTRATGHVQFTGDGLNVWTEGATSTDKAAEYFAIGEPTAVDRLPATAGMVWHGTQPQPGVQIVFDYDTTTGNGNDWNILVGEPVYGTDASGNPTDWWLTNGSSADAKAVAPNTSGGSGSGWHGTLAQWSAALANENVYAGGFSLGSGVKGDGTIRSITYDSATFTFSNVTTPVVPVVNVTGDVTSVVKGRKVKLTFLSAVLPAGAREGKTIAWRVTVDGKDALSFTQHANDETKWATKVPSKGKHKVRVYKDGALIKTIVVKHK